MGAAKEELAALKATQAEVEEKAQRAKAAAEAEARAAIARRESLEAEYTKVAAAVSSLENIGKEQCAALLAARPARSIGTAGTPYDSSPTIALPGFRLAVARFGQCVVASYQRQSRRANAVVCQPGSACLPRCAGRA